MYCSLSSRSISSSESVPGAERNHCCRHSRQKTWPQGAKLVWDVSLLKICLGENIHVGLRDEFDADLALEGRFNCLEEFFIFA